MQPVLRTIEHTLYGAILGVCAVPCLVDATPYIVDALTRGCSSAGQWVRRQSRDDRAVQITVGFATYAFAAKLLQSTSGRFGKSYAAKTFIYLSAAVIAGYTASLARARHSPYVTYGAATLGLVVAISKLFTPAEPPVSDSSDSASQSSDESSPQATPENSPPNSPRNTLHGDPNIQPD